MSEKPLEVVVGILSQGDPEKAIGTHKLLLRKRDHKPDREFPGAWELPGGKVEASESHGEALIRELREEIGVVIPDEPGAMYPFTFISIEATPTSRAVKLTYYRVLKWVGEPVAVEPDTVVEWVPYDEVGKREITPGTRQYGWKET